MKFHLPSESQSLQQGPTLRRATVSEWLKFATLPSLLFTTITAIFLILGVATLRFIATIANGKAGTGYGSAELLASQLHEGVIWAGILLAVMSVLFVAAEYTSGSIRTTVLAVPTRSAIVFAKASVLATIGMLSGSIASGIVLFTANLAADQYKMIFDVPAPFLIQLALGSGFYLACINILAMGLAFIIRNLVSALVTVLCLITVAPLILAAVPISWVRDIVSYFPSTAGQLIFSTDSSGVMTPWVGVLVLGIWSCIAFTAGAAMLQQRDT